MNWIKENKFLTGFMVVMLLGLGGIGYLLFTAMGKYDAAQMEYSGKSAELTRLQKLNPSPTKKTLDQLVAQKKEASEVVADFQKSLAAISIPAEPMTPEQFQDKLKATKTAIVEKAAAAGTTLPAKFFLGFDAYEGRPPAADAATPLGRQLKGIEWVLTQLFDSRVIELGSEGKDPIKRDPLPEESGKKAEEPVKKGAGGSKEAKAKPLVTTHSFEIKMVCKQDALARVLNALVGPQAPQFFIPRLITVKNEKSTLPKTDLNPNPDKEKKSGGFILGEEKLQVTLVIDMVDFAAPPASAAK
ncbi:MAG: Amuc_1100 family pilus-like protein [Chthoniobacter sp.]|nr:Amuc_1100 family pilus-like protein [Chthoniobacter sp.]